MNIRIGTFDDRQTIINILNSTTLDLLEKGIPQWEYPWNEKEILHDMDKNQAFLMFEENQPVGVFFIKEKGSLSSLTLKPGSLYLNQVAILPKYQGKNLGSKITAFAQKMANQAKKDLYVDCWAGNGKLKAFYNRNGFELLGDYPEADYFVSIFKYKKEGNPMTREELKLELGRLNAESSLTDIQSYVHQMIETRGFSEETIHDVMLMLMEEVGELAREVNKMSGVPFDVAKEKKLDLEGEIADVFLVLLAICRNTGVDLFTAFKNKEERNSLRVWK